MPGYKIDQITGKLQDLPGIQTFERAEALAAAIVPEFKASLARADELMAACHFNEAIRVIDTLIKEAEDMKIASRFRADLLMKDKVLIHDLHPDLQEMNEAEFKRAQLLRDLQKVRTAILDTIGQLHNIVLDMDATKIEA